MSAEWFTLDTNILVYALDIRAGSHRHLADRIIGLALQRDCRLTLQAVSEFYAATIRKRLVPVNEAAAQAEDWLSLFPIVTASPDSVRHAVRLASAGQASYWDALLLASAAEAGGVGGVFRERQRAEEGLFGRCCCSCCCRCCSQEARLEVQAGARRGCCRPRVDFEEGERGL